MAPDDGDGAQDFYLLCRVNGVTNGRTRNSSASGKLSELLLPCFRFSSFCTRVRSAFVSLALFFLVNLLNLLLVFFSLDLYVFDTKYLYSRLFLFLFIFVFFSNSVSDEDIFCNK